MPNVNPFATEEQWRAAGSPGGDYAAWLTSIGYGADGQPVAGPPASEPLYNADGSSKNGKVGAQQTNADGGVSPQSFEDRLAAGEFGEGMDAEATQLEVRRRRRLLEDNNGMKPLPPDVADIVLRDSSGKVRKARSASTQSALGAAFDSKAPLFGER